MYVWIPLEEQLILQTATPLVVGQALNSKGACHLCSRASVLGMVVE